MRLVWITLMLYVLAWLFVIGLVRMHYVSPPHFVQEFSEEGR